MSYFEENGSLNIMADFQKIHVCTTESSKKFNEFSH